LHVTFFQFFALVFELLVQVLELFHERSRELQQKFAILCQPHFRPAPCEERHRQFILKASDLLRDGRLAQSHPLGGLRDASMLRVAESLKLLATILF
jgi:hypothetical protein